MTILPGSAVRITAVFHPGNGAHTDPATVTLDINDPSGATTTYTDSDYTTVKTDSYRYDYVPATAGTYRYRWTSTGDVAHVSEGSFTVRASSF